MKSTDTEEIYFDDEDDSGDECPYCGAEYYYDSPQCPSCGNYFSREDEPAHSKSVFIWLGFILCMIVMAGFVLRALAAGV